MKTAVLSVLAVFPLSLALFGQTSFAEVCGASVFSTSPFPPAAQWRQAFTLASQDSSIPATSPAREREMSARVDEMEREILGIKEFTGKGDTPPIEIFPAEGVSYRYLFHSVGYHQGNTRIVLSHVGGSTLSATVLAPVSGHVGAENAKAWAKTDTFSFTYDVSTDKDGNQWTASWGNGPTEKPLIKNAPSKGLVTAQDMNIPLSKDHVTRILYYRSGSSGPAGYTDGRELELVWDGT